MIYSDHAPILAVLNSQCTRINKRFRFENWWLMDTDYNDIAMQSWQHSFNRDFSQKTKFLAADLRKWRKRNPETMTYSRRSKTKSSSNRDYHLLSRTTLSNKTYMTRTKTSWLKKKPTTFREPRKTGQLQVTETPPFSIMQ